MKRIPPVLLITLGLAAPWALAQAQRPASQGQPPYLDPARPPEERARDIVSHMTLEEKINTGNRAGEEVVQLYLTHPGVEGAPLRALQGFTRIALEPGEQKTVRLPLDDRRMSLVDEAGVRRILPGTVEVWIGGGQPVETPGLAAPAGSRTRFRVTGAAVLPE